VQPTIGSGTTAVKKALPGARPPHETVQPSARADACSDCTLAHSNTSFLVSNGSPPQSYTPHLDFSSAAASSNGSLLRLAVRGDRYLEPLRSSNTILDRIPSPLPS
jgi:hypothetical protein